MTINSYEITPAQSYCFFLTDPDLNQLKNKFHVSNDVLLDFYFDESVSAQTLQVSKKFNHMTYYLEVENPNTGVYEKYSYTPDKSEKRALKRSLKKFIKKGE